VNIAAAKNATARSLRQSRATAQGLRHPVRNSG
jgi:hypothetical protein